MNTITPRSEPRLVLIIKSHVAVPKPAERRREPVYFLKAHVAGDGQLGGYAHKGGYYLHNGHWHAINKDKPAPKSAPKASHPEAAGSHIPAKHLTDDEWSQLKLPDSNVNAPSYNAQLDKLKEMAEAGHVTGIVGSGYGTNTYGKKLAVVANHLLGKYGSPHKVAPGQKAGEHPAVQGSVDAVVEHKDAVIKEAIEHLKEDANQAGMPAGEAAEDKALVQKLESAHAVKLPQIPMPSAVQLLQPTGLKADVHGAVVQQIKGLYESGGLAELKKIKESLFTPAFTGAILYKGKGAKGITKYLDATIADLESKAPIAPAAPSPVAAVQPASTSQVGMIPWDKMVLPATNSNAGSHNKKVAQIKALAEAGDTAGLAAMKFGVNTYGIKQAKLAQTAIAALNESPTKPQAVAPSPVAPAPAPALAPVPAPAPAPVVASSPIVKSAAMYKNTAGTSNKFWSVSTFGNVMKTVYGKNGTAGQTTEKTFGSASEAINAANVLAAAKKAKGYAYSGTIDHEHTSTQGAASPAASAPAPAPQGPKNGDTKPAADGGMLVFKDGHWHKQSAPATSAVKLSASKLKSVLAGHIKPKNKIVAQAKQAALTGDVDLLQSAFLMWKSAGKDMPQTAAVLTAIAAAMKATLPSAPAPAATAPVAPAVVSSALTPMDSWTQTGPQGGSNPGGKFQDPSGQEWYCKFPADEDHAKSEVLAANLYALAGVAGQDAKLITRNGKIGIASRWMGGTKESAGNLAKADGVHSGFAVDAWLSNWDVIGATNDNLLLDSNGKAVRIDAGGSLGYRAMGKKKTLTNKVDDIKTMLDSNINPSTSAVFGSMSPADITASVAKVAAISDAAIFDMVNQHGAGSLEDKQKLAATLIARKNDLIKQYPDVAKKKKKPVFDPSKITAPPSFMDWGGSGFPGPSSKLFVNQSNHDAVQAIYAEAQKGSIPAIQQLQLDTYDKNTGQVTGKVSALAHPSQHVKGYAQQAINEINYQLNPPKVFRFNGGHPLQALNAAYPAVNKNAGAAVPTVARFLLVGEPGTIKLEDFGLPPLDSYVDYGGTVSIATYKTQAQAAFKKMPKTQIDALRAYTGSGYHKINNSLWSGNPTGEAIAAATALKTLSHDITPGTVLSRKIKVYDDAELKELLGSVGKVLQEERVISTSIDPDIWSGNVHLKLIVGPGVKGLYVGEGSNPNGGAISVNEPEKEIILPPNTRLVVTKITSGAKMIDKQGFGDGSSEHLIEAVILPST